MAAKVPDLLLLHQVVAPEILAARKSASAQLTRSRVRHALIGALAVGAWGYPRASKDVDFLVGDEAFEHHEGNIVTMAAGVPIGVEGIAIAHLGALPDERHLEAALSRPVMDGGVPIAPLEALYLKSHAPDLLAKFEAVAGEAQSE